MTSAQCDGAIIREVAGSRPHMICGRYALGVATKTRLDAGSDVHATPLGHAIEPSPRVSRFEARLLVTRKPCRYREYRLEVVEYVGCTNLCLCVLQEQTVQRHKVCGCCELVQPGAVAD